MCIIHSKYVLCTHHTLNVYINLMLFAHFKITYAHFFCVIILYIIVYNLIIYNYGKKNYTNYPT